MYRLDNLLTESRHLQENIIYNLRSPILYRPLRYEEDFLWGYGAYIHIRETDLYSAKKIADEIAHIAVIGLPLPGQLSKEDPETPAYLKKEIKNKIDDRKVISEKLNKFVVDKAWIKGQWSTDQRRHYHSLRMIQIIKRNMFSDKILIGSNYLSQIRGRNKYKNIDVFSEFILLRSAIMKRIHSYIARLGDHQDQYAKTMDMALQDHPRPSVERRREQRIYTTHLSDQCRDLWLQLNFLMEGKFGIPDNNNSFHPPILLHRWQHKDTSESESYYNDIDQSDSSTSDNQNQGPYHHYINTSYFMPERPDLQPVIAHEVAHAFVRDSLGDLSDAKISAPDNKFMRLVRRINQCIENFKLDQQNLPLSPSKEIIVDLLAASIKGPAYLYALFLEIMGYTLCGLYYSGPVPDKIDLRMHCYLKGSGGAYDQDRLWYLRLTVIAKFIECIYKKPDSFYKKPDSLKKHLSIQLCETINKICESTIDYLDTIAIPQEQSGRYWKSLAKQLCRIIDDSEVPVIIGGWWQERTEDRNKGYDEKFWPSHTRPFHPRINEFLSQWYIHKKFDYYVTLNKIEENKFETPFEFFKKIAKEKYNYTINDSKPPKENDIELFQYLFDIPWQCALMDALECMVDEDDKKKTYPCIEAQSSGIIDWLDIIYKSLILRREIYQIGLDFHFQDIDAPYLRLEEILRLLTDDSFCEQVKNDDSISEDMKQAIGEWLNGNENWTESDNNSTQKSEEQLEKIAREILKPYKKKISEKKVKEIAEKNTAEDIIWIWHNHSKINNNDSFRNKKFHRKYINRIIGFKLKKLHDDVSKIDDGTSAIFSPLKSYLGIRPDKDPPDKDASLCKKLSNVLSKGTPDEDAPFFKKITNALLKKDYNKNQKILPSNHYHAIGRVSTGSYHRALKNNKGNLTKDFFYQNRIRIENKFITNGLIGRYDNIIIGPAYRRGHQWILDIFSSDKPNESENEPLFIPKCGRKDKCDTYTSLKKIYPCLVSNKIKASEENFLPYFVRWEFAAPIRLTKEDWHFSNEPPLALISIVLKQSTARLDFIYRLLLTSHKNTEPKKNTDPQNLEELVGYFEKTDKAFLSDGWEDLLIILDGNYTRLPDIFKIHNILFEDFQVDRTELILTPKALNYALYRKGKDSYGYEDVRLRVLIRLMDDWGLSRGYKMFKDKVADNWEKSMKDLPFTGALSHVPSRMDFSLRLSHNQTNVSLSNDQTRRLSDKFLNDFLKEKDYRLSHGQTKRWLDKILDDFLKEKDDRLKLGHYLTKRLSDKILNNLLKEKDYQFFLHKKLIEILNNTKVDRLQMNLGWCGKRILGNSSKKVS
jgi:hypothetical protein